MAGDNVVTLSDDNFQTEVLDSSTPVLVDFWAEWCMPCKMLAPTIDEIAGEFGDKVKVGKLDIDSNQSTSINFQITAIPTVLIFKDGEVKKKFVGMTKKGDLQDALNELA
ncbi:MAG: thioredoxin [Planctomycetota bacterium]